MGSASNTLPSAPPLKATMSNKGNAPDTQAGLRPTQAQVPGRTNAPAGTTGSFKGAAFPTNKSTTTPAPPRSSSSASGVVSGVAASAAGLVANAARQVASSAASAGPTMQQQQRPQRSDRLVAFLSTLVTYPFLYLLVKEASGASMQQLSGVRGSGGIDTRKRLGDFPEGEALLELESWCREPVYTSWVYEWATRSAAFSRQLLLTLLPYPLVLQVLNNAWLLKTLQIPATGTLQELLASYMPTAQEATARGMPHVAVRNLQSQLEPSLVSLKSRLEEKVVLTRGPTPLERLDFITALARTAARLFFGWLRGLARLCTYVSSLLSVLSGALSFTVVPSIILSVISAALGVGQLLLMGTADLLEPAVKALLALTETSKDTAAALGGSPECSPVGVRVLPASTVEQLEPFFDKQLRQESGLLNRPEIPHLASLNRPLLVKAYDLGLIDARGRTETHTIAQMLGAAEAQGLSHVLLRGLIRAGLAATSLDVPTLLMVAQQTLEGVSSALLPASLGGRRASLRQLFRPDGFFAYADDRQAQVAVVLLARLLSWLHLSQVVAPSSPACLRFVLVLGERQAGKATLFSRLVDAPAEYAAQLGGGGATGPLDGTTDMGAQAKAPLTNAAAAPGAPIPSNSAAYASSGPSLAPAVDMQGLSGHLNTYVVVVPGLHSADESTRKKAQNLAGIVGSLASAVVFLVHPSSTPAPHKLQLLIPALAAGCRCLVAVNGPSRLDNLGQPGGVGHRTSNAGTGVTHTPSSPLEVLRSQWQSAAEALCNQHGLNPSLLGVVVSEVVEVEGAGELPVGVQHLQQLQDWVVTTAGQAHRMV